MHLRTLKVGLSRPFTADAMAELGLDAEKLEHLLWDRVLHRELTRSGAEVIVDKTPANALIWRRIRRAWPDARYVFLRRHPGAIFTSVMRRRKDADDADVTAELLRYVEHLDAAYAAHGGLIVRYEDLTESPETVTKTICSFLDLDWERSMLDYGHQEHGPFKPFLGDWSEKIRSGAIAPARSVASPDEYPRALDAAVEGWGYSELG